MNTFKCTVLQNAQDKQQLLNQYQITVQRHQDLMSKKEKSKSSSDQGDQHNISDDEIHFKAEKLELDRQLSHLVLDKEILVKNHAMLHQQIEKKTEGLYEQRVVLEEKRSGIQV